MRTRFLRLVPLLLLSLPAKGLACAVCMGAPGSAVVDAGNGFVFTMLGILGVMFAGIGGFFFSLTRHAKAPLPAHEELAQLVYGGGIRARAETMLNHLLGMPQSASEHGFLIDHMLEVCHWFMLVLFIGWSTFFCTVLFLFHKSRHPKADYYGVKTKASTHIEFMVVLIEAVLLLGFALPLWAKRVTEFPKDKDAQVIKVTGKQFTWLFHYPGPDGQFGGRNLELISTSNYVGLDPKDPAGKDDIVIPNELHLLVNKPVILEIGSMDVIHSLSLQSMFIGQDAIPGTITPIWFKPIRTGQYEIICGQLCGQGHYNMRGAMFVDSPEDYAAWMKENAPAGSTPPAAAKSPATPAASALPEPQKK